MLRLGFEKARLPHRSLLHGQQRRHPERHFEKDRDSAFILCQLNGLSRNSHLKPGQRIKLTQANLPVKPALGSASCSVKGSSKKHEAAKPGKLEKKSSKPAEAKAGHKPAAKPGTSKSLTMENSKSRATAKQAAQKPVAKETAKSGKLSAAQRKTTETKPSASKAKVKPTAQSGKHTSLAKR